MSKFNELVNKILGFNSHIVVEPYSKEINPINLFDKKKNTLFKDVLSLFIIIIT